MPCEPAVQATVVASSAATSTARTARGLTLLIRRCSSPAHLLLVSHVLIAYFPRLPTVTQD